MSEKLPDLLPNIDSFLEQVDGNSPIDLEGLDELVLTVRAYTGLDYDKAEILIKNYFQIIRNEVLNGKRMTIYRVGNLSLRKDNTRTKFTPNLKLKMVLRNYSDE
jgi:nucleoid DNA-binding protein